jgi:hypothetical protein
MKSVGNAKEAALKKEQLIVVALSILLFVGFASAQIIRQIEGPVDEMFDIPELSAMIIGGEKDLKIDFVAPKDMRLKGYEDVEVKEGDVVLLFNGKRVKTVADLKGAYETAAVGDTVKVGIRRGTEMFFASFKKADPKTLPKRKIVIDDGPDGAPRHGEGATTRTLTFKSGGKDAEGARPILELGILAGVADKKVKVLQKLILPGSSAPVVDLQAGDLLETLNGKIFSSPDELAGLLDKIPVGERIELKYSRREKTLNASFAKPEPRGRVMIRKTQ